MDKLTQADNYAITGPPNKGRSVIVQEETLIIWEYLQQLCQ